MDYIAIKTTALNSKVVPWDIQVVLEVYEHILEIDNSKIKLKGE